MNKWLKRAGSVSLAAVLLCTAAAAMPQAAFGSIVANAQATYNTYNDLYYLDNGETITIMGYSGSAADISIPSQIDRKKVTRIGSDAFSSCQTLKTIAIPSTVESIGELAFSGCTSLTAINVDSDNRFFASEDGILYDKDKTSLICCPSAKANIGQVPQGITIINESGFEDCIHLNSITLPESLTVIGAYAFWGCSNMANIRIPVGVVTIGENALGYYYDSNYDICSVKGFTIYGAAGSAAEQYASDHAFAFIQTGDVAVSGVELNKTSLSLAPGQTAALTAAVMPSDATDKTVTWSTSDEAVAVVEGGKVTAVGDGSCRIIARSANGKKAECTVNVSSLVEVTKIKLYKTKITLGVGENYLMATTIIPGTATDKSVAWTTSDSSIADVKDGLIIAKATGTAVITAQTKNGKTAACRVTVKKAPSKVTLAEKTLTLGLGETYVFSPEMPYGCASEGNTYRSDNNSVIRGTKSEQFAEFKALKLGTANITVTTYNGQTASCKVVVKKAPTWVQLSKQEITLKVGDRATLTAKMAKDTGCSRYSFRSDDPTVAQMISTTGSGVFKAVKPGVTNVTVTLFNGKQASCKVTVTE